MSTLPSALTQASFDQQDTPDTTSAPAVPQVQAPNPLQQLLSQQQRKRRSTAGLVGKMKQRQAISRSSRARQTGDKWGS